MALSFFSSMLFFIALLLLIGTPVLAVFLRLAISLANRIIGPQQPSTDPALIDIPSLAGLPSNDANPYAPPRTVSIAVEKDNVSAIPMPTLWSAFGIVLMAVGLSAVSSLLISNFAPGSLPTLQWLALGTGFGLWVLTYSLMLPTSLRRAAFVYLIQFAMALVFFGVIFAAAWAV
jgi:hypothetical protein